MDSFEINKIMGALTGMFAVYLGISFVGEGIYKPAHGSGHGDGAHGGLAYFIELEEDVAEEDAEPVIELTMAELLQQASASAGARVFNKCKSCHNIEEGGSNGIGPNLWGVMGADIAGHDDYSYSNALLDIDGAWDWEAMYGFLKAPKDWAPGTKMGFAGLSKQEDRAAILVYLNEQGSSPIALPAE